MKKTLKCMMLLFGFVAVMSFSSCQKDEDLLIGKWKLEEKSYKSLTKGFMLSDWDYISFKEDGMATMIDMKDPYSFAVAYEWIDEETIFIYCDNFKVISLTRNELILKEIDHRNNRQYVYSRAD